MLVKWNLSLVKWSPQKFEPGFVNNMNMFIVFKIKQNIYTDQKFWQNTQNIAIIFVLQNFKMKVGDYMKTHKRFSSVYLLTTTH